MWFPSLHLLWELDPFRRDAGSPGRHSEEVIFNQMYFQTDLSPPRAEGVSLVVGISFIFCLTPCSVPGGPVAGTLICGCLWSHCVSSVCVQLSYLSACLAGVQPHAALGSEQRWLGGPVLRELSQRSHFGVTNLNGADNGVLCVCHSDLQNWVPKLAIVFTVL